LSADAQAKARLVEEFNLDHPYFTISGFDHPSVPVDAVREILETLADLLTRYRYAPGLAEHMTDIRGLAIEFLGSELTNAEMVGRAGKTRDRWMRLNLSRVADRARALEDDATDRKTGFHPSSGQPYRDDVIHEFAHAIDDATGQRLNREADNTLRQAWAALFIARLITEPFEQWLQRLPASAFTDRTKDTLDPVEAVAAGFADGEINGALVGSPQWVIHHFVTTLSPPEITPDLAVNLPSAIAAPGDAGDPTGAGNDSIGSRPAGNTEAAAYRRYRDRLGGQYRDLAERLSVVAGQPLLAEKGQRAGGSPAPGLPAEVRTCLPWVVDILQRNGLPVLPVTGRRAVHFQTATGSGLQHQPITTRERSDDPMWKAVDDLRTKPVGTYAVAVVGRGERAHAYIITRRTNPGTGLTTTYVHDQLTGGDPRPYLDWKATYTEPEHTYIAYFEPTGTGTLEARTTPDRSQVAPSFEGIDITGAPGRNPDGRSLLRWFRERRAAQTEEQKNLTKFAVWSGVAGAGSAGAATYLINAVQQTTGSVEMTGMASALMSSAALAATLPGGMLVDRNARRWMMRAGLLGSVAAGGTALYAGLGLPGTVEALIGAGTVMAATGAVYSAGVQVYGPSLISTPEGRKAADTLMMIDRHSSGMLGRFTWPIMANISAAMPLWASAATGLANWWSMRGLPDTSPEKKEKPSMREVARTMWDDRYMRYYQGLLIPWGVGGSAIGVQLAALMDEANYSPQSIGMVAASAGIGTLFGAALKAWKSFRAWIKDRTLGLTFGSWMIQAGTLAATDNQWIVAGAAAATGATVMLNNIDFAYYLRNLTGNGLGQGWSITNTVNQVSAIAGSGLVIPAVATLGRTGAGLATAGMFAGATAAALVLENGVRRQWWEELRDDCLDRTARILHGLGKEDATAPRGRKRNYKTLEKYTRGTLVEYHLPADTADETTDPQAQRTPGVFGPLIDQVKNAERTEVDTMDVLVDDGGNTMHVFTIVNTGPGQAIIFDTNIKHAEAKSSGEKKLHIPRVIDADEFTHPYEAIRRIHTARYRRTEDGTLEDINKDLLHRDRGEPPRKKRIAGPPEPNEKRTTPETSIAAEQHGARNTSEVDSVLRRARGNDEAAFEQLRGKYGRSLFAKVLADLGVPATAVTPELRPLVRVAQGLNRLAFDIADQYRWRVQDAAPLEWLHGIASNLVTGWFEMNATQRGHAAAALAAAQHGGNLTVVQRGALERILEAGRRDFEAEGKHPSGIDTTAPPGSGVTNRQFMVLQLIAAGLTSHQIGTELGLSPGTVGIYRNELHRRFGARNGAELVYLALSAGVLASTVPVGDRSPATAMIEPTSRELQLLIRIANGDTSNDIAQDLDITSGVVDEQVADLRRRLGAPNRPATVLAAVRAGYLELGPPDAPGSAVPTLSPREIDLLTRVANGETTKDIARALGPSPSVVDEYLTRIGSKLRVHNRAAMVAVALRNGMLPDIHPTSRDTADLTSAEVDLLDRVANGQTNTDIAKDLETTYGRVDVALAGIRQKLGVRNRQESVAIAIRTGILPGMPTASRATGDHDNTATPSPTRSQPRTSRSRHIGARPRHSGIPDDAQASHHRPAGTPWSGNKPRQADSSASTGPGTASPAAADVRTRFGDSIRRQATTAIDLQIRLGKLTLTAAEKDRLVDEIAEDMVVAAGQILTSGPPTNEHIVAAIGGARIHECLRLARCRQGIRAALRDEVRSGRLGQQLAGLRLAELERRLDRLARSQPDQQRCLALRHRNGLSVRATARTMGIGVDAVHTLESLGALAIAGAPIVAVAPEAEPEHKPARTRRPTADPLALLKVTAAFQHARAAAGTGDRAAIDALIAIIEQLDNPHHRQVLNLRFLQSMTIPQIATSLDQPRSVGATKQLLRRAVRVLAQQLDAGDRGLKVPASARNAALVAPDGIRSVLGPLARRFRFSKNGRVIFLGGSMVQAEVEEFLGKFLSLQPQLTALGAQPWFTATQLRIRQTLAKAPLARYFNSYNAPSVMDSTDPAVPLQGIRATVEADGTLRLTVLRSEHTPPGRQMFDDMWAEIGHHVRRIAGQWEPNEVLHGNLDTFNRLVQQGHSPQDGAFGTWTGKMARRRGLTDVTVEIDYDNQSVWALFTRPQRDGSTAHQGPNARLSSAADQPRTTNRGQTPDPAAQSPWGRAKTGTPGDARTASLPGQSTGIPRSDSIGARPRSEEPGSGSNDREAQWGRNPEVAQQPRSDAESVSRSRFSLPAPLPFGRNGFVLPALGFDDGVPHQPERTVPLAGAQFAADIARRQLREERAEQSADAPDRLRDLDATDQLYARLDDARREHTAALLRYGYWDAQTVDLSGWRDHDIAENDLFWLSYRQADPGERAQQREAARQYREARDRLAAADRDLTRLVEAAGIDPRQADLGRHASLVGALQTFADLVGADWVRRPDHPDFGAAPDDLADSVRARVLRYPGETYLAWELRRLGPGAVALVSDTSRGDAGQYVLSNIDGTIVEIERSTGVLREFAPEDNSRSKVEGVFFGPDKRPVHPVGGAWDRIPLFDPSTARQRGAEVTRLHTATAAQQQDGLSELAARRLSVMLKQYVVTAEYRNLATKLGLDPETLSRQQLDRMAQTPRPPAEESSADYLPAPAPRAERLPELVRQTEPGSTVRR
jgi:DNA-binding NarL/FixJ family response regulator/DNA-directed RNA polymerase specialized sigma24 family protein/MFS family permease